MDTRALGLIETVGYIPAVEAADMAVKSADVSIQGIKYAGKGLVTVIIRGDISSVKAAVEVAEVAARRLGVVRSYTVIGRVGEGLSILLDEPESDQVEPISEEQQPQQPPSVKQQKDLLLPEREILETLRVTQLRQFVRQLEGFPLDKKKIKYARRVELLELIADYRNSRGI